MFDVPLCHLASEPWETTIVQGVPVPANALPSPPLSSQQEVDCGDCVTICFPFMFLGSCRSPYLPAGLDIPPS